jgi:hypothetical protein|tara:strand:+ start:1463 stop:1579 length:117 start_codon:yes stop_codon:yes gene_type:complete
MSLRDKEQTFEKQKRRVQGEPQRRFKSFSLKKKFTSLR